MKSIEMIRNNSPGVDIVHSKFLKVFKFDLDKLLIFIYKLALKTNRRMEGENVILNFK